MYSEPLNCFQAPKNVKLVPSAGKHATGAAHGKRATDAKHGKIRTGVKHRKACNGAKRGKTYNWYQARKDMQLMPSAGKHVTGPKRGKTCNCFQACNRFFLREQTENSKKLDTI